MITIKNKDTCTNGVPQSRMKTEDAENITCFPNCLGIFVHILQVCVAIYSYFI